MKTMNLLGIFLVSFLWLEIEGQACPPLYKRYCNNHTGCLQRNPKCDIRNSEIPSSSEKDTILQKHNEYRSKVATGAETKYPKATDMLQMVWDDELAAVALKHSEQCVFAHDPNECRRVKNFGVGQNLYERRMYPHPPTKSNWEGAIKSWYDEVVDYKPENVDSFKGEEGPKPTGHFTQMIWSSTWRIGCHRTMFREGKFYVEHYTCNYGPAGNVENEPLYKRGEPGTGCPENSCYEKSCSTQSYPGLCQIKGNSAPRYKPIGKPIFFCSFIKGQSDCNRNVTSGENNWQVSETLSGNNLGIVLNGGQSSTVSFTTSFQGKKEMCVITYYRKGPQVAGQDGTNSAVQIIGIPERGYTFKSELYSNSVDYIKMGISLNWPMPSTLAVRFSVPAGKPAQYLELTDIEVKEGNCVKSRS